MDGQMGTWTDGKMEDQLGVQVVELNFSVTGRLFFWLFASPQVFQVVSPPPSSSLHHSPAPPSLLSTSLGLCRAAAAPLVSGRVCPLAVLLWGSGPEFPTLSGRRAPPLSARSPESRLPLLPAELCLVSSTLQVLCPCLDSPLLPSSLNASTCRRLCRDSCHVSSDGQGAPPMAVITWCHDEV